ncbi:MAG TPA: hypothetical protein PL051_03715 [Candidatus Saccharibacteria bacterium]|nr:hypothetical protein [Candidatus Saccharibacteria bacterium]
MTKEILAEEKIDIDAFVDALRACAQEALARTRHVKVADFPEAIEWAQRNDEDFAVDFKACGGTQVGLTKILRDFEDRLRAHIREDKTDELLRSFGFIASNQ